MYRDKTTKRRTNKTITYFFDRGANKICFCQLVFVCYCYIQTFVHRPSENRASNGYNSYWFAYFKYNFALPIVCFVGL